MNAITPTRPLFFNFDKCPEPLDQRGRVTWAKLYELQSHIEITSLRREIEELHENSSFDEACKRADANLAAERQAGQRRESLEILRARRLLNGDASLERCWYEINDRRNHPTPQATIEAVLYSVRSRGVGSLKEPANVAHLSDCDEAAKAQINRRIAKLIETTKS